MGAHFRPMTRNTISHYRIVKLIGASGMGTVYHVIDTTMGSHFAMKLLPPKSMTDERARERFHREARAIAALNHPGIPTIHDLGEEGDTPFLVMELFEGETLQDLIRKKQLSLDQVIHLGLQIADALAYAHSQGIVHRDIKPANLFVTHRGQVKILDFGLARFESGSESSTSADGPVGTLMYMAPEMLQRHFADQRSDIYSFGAVLYEMATGRTPFFEHESTSRLIDAILNKKPIPLRSLNPNVPLGLEFIILKSLEKDPANRYESMKEIAGALSVVEHTQMLAGAHADQVSSKSAAWNSGERFARFTLLAMSALICVGLILLRGTVIGFGLTFGAALLAYESFLLLRTYKK